MKRFFSVVGAFIIATGLSCATFTRLGFAESLDDLSGEEDTDYETTRQTAIDLIVAYQDSLTNGLDNDELKNKNLNAEQKKAVIDAYNLLHAEDQAPYTELITLIERGGVPQLEFIGATEYDSVDDVNFYQIIRATDNEDNNADGVMELNADNTTCNLTQEYLVEGATHQPYSIKCFVTDSDHNVSELTQEIRIKITTPPDDKDPGDNTDDPNNPGQDPDNPDNPDNPDQPGQDPDNPGGNDNPDDNNPDNPGDTGDDQDPDKNPGGDQPGDDQPGDDTPGGDPGNQPGDKPGDQPGDDGNNDGNDDDKNDDKNDSQNPSDDNQPGNSDTPNTPGSTGSNNSSNSNNGTKLPTSLPNTGPSALFSQISPAVYLSVLIGLVAATTVFCLTKRQEAKNEI